MKGAFYPPKLPAKQMLSYYGENFQTVEINYTFKRLPTAAILKSWADAVPADFRICAQSARADHAPQRFKDVDQRSATSRHRHPLEEAPRPAVVSNAAELQERHVALRAFLELLPPRRRVAFEFRHPSWFDDETFQMIARSSAALCIAVPTKASPSHSWQRRMGLPALAGSRLRRCGIAKVGQAKCGNRIGKMGLYSSNMKLKRRGRDSLNASWSWQCCPSRFANLTRRTGAADDYAECTPLPHSASRGKKG